MATTKPAVISQTLLENALDHVREGIERFFSEEEPSTGAHKFGLSDLYTGVLLLLKERHENDVIVSRFIRVCDDIFEVMNRGDRAKQFGTMIIPAAEIAPLVRKQEMLETRMSERPFGPDEPCVCGSSRKLKKCCGLNSVGCSGRSRPGHDDPRVSRPGGGVL